MSAGVQFFEVSHLSVYRVLMFRQFNCRNIKGSD